MLRARAAILVPEPQILFARARGFSVHCQFRCPFHSDFGRSLFVHRSGFFVCLCMRSLFFFLPVFHFSLPSSFLSSFLPAFLSLFRSSLTSFQPSFLCLSVLPSFPAFLTLLPSFFLSSFLLSFLHYLSCCIAGLFLSFCTDHCNELHLRFLPSFSMCNKMFL